MRLDSSRLAQGLLRSGYTKGDTSKEDLLNAYRYTAKRYDLGSKMLDMGARRFSPGANRFLRQNQYMPGR